MDKMTRRQMLRWSLAALAGVGIAACAPPAPAPTAAPAAKPAQTTAPAAVAPTAPPAAAKAPAAAVSVRVQDWAGDWATVAAPLFSDLMQKRTDIKIVYEPYQEGWIEKTMAAMVAGDAADVIHVWSDNAAQFASRGQLQNLESMFQETYTKDQQKDFHAFQIQGFFRDGFRYAMPKHVWLGILYYSKDAFDQAKVSYPSKDWTYDDYSAALEKLTTRDGNKVTRWGGYMPVWSFDRLLPKIQAFGGHAADAQTHTLSLLGEKPAQDALEWVRSRMWDKNSVAQQMQVDKKDGYDSLINGLVAMAEEGTSQIVKVAKNMKVNWDIALHPKGPAARVALGSTNGYAIYKGTSTRGNAKAAWDVIQFMTTPDFQRAMLKAESRTIVPSRKSAVPDFIANLKKLQPALEKVNLDIIKEGLDTDYALATDPEMFKNHPAAMEIIQPALDKLFLVGDAKPSILVDLKAKIEASQK
jgi:multiple sugar transport system substrate-binding protein